MTDDYTLRRNADGSTARAESPQDAADLMLGVEDAEEGRVGVAFVERVRRIVRIPNFWPLARPDVVAKGVADSAKAIEEAS